MKVRWTLPAADQLREVYDFIAADNLTAARRTVERIRQAIRIASVMPLSGRPGRTAGTRELIVPNTPYIVAYKIDSNHLHVLAVWHGARLWPESF
jgi:toxin ParE1/3/4